MSIQDLENGLLYSIGINPETKESVLTIEMLTDLIDSMPVPRDDRIFVVSEGYWPHEYLLLTKDKGEHFILNDVGFRNLKNECASSQNYQQGYNSNTYTHFSGIRVEYIDAKKASEMVCKSFEHSRKNEFEITGAKLK